VERVKGIEPSYEAWEAAVLPLNYTRAAPSIVSSRRRSLVAFAGGVVLLAGCAIGPWGAPVSVNLVGLELLPSEGLEVRVMARLRVQNAGEADIDFDGIALEIELRGMSFASGVSDQRGSVPRFGERVLAVPMTISATALMRQALALAAERGSPNLRLDYVVHGRLGGAMMGGRHFENRGQIDWPLVAAGSAPAR
jgi:hypothetical protein